MSKISRRGLFGWMGAVASSSLFMSRALQVRSAPSLTINRVREHNLDILSAQRLYDYHATAIIEHGTLTPKAPYYG